MWWNLLNGETGIAAATLTLQQNVSDQIKLAKTILKSWGKHLQKAQAATDCSKMLKFMAKISKGVEKVLNKYGPPNV
jgi:predicted hydrocarbon binding protein